MTRDELHPLNHWPLHFSAFRIRSVDSLKSATGLGPSGMLFERLGGKQHMPRFQMTGVDNLSRDKCEREIFLANEVFFKTMLLASIAESLWVSDALQ